LPTVRKEAIIRTVDHAQGAKAVAKSHLKLVTPSTEIRTVRPTRRPNADLRTREYLIEAEVERLLKATSENRWAHRDATMILVAYRHGLRASELTDLRWDQVDFATATLHVRRVKQGSPSTHPILGDELRWLRRLQREQEPKLPFVFTSGRGTPFTTAGFARMVERAGAEVKAHPHMLRHACGFALASKGHTPAPFRPISVTRTSSTPCAIPSCRRLGSRTFGGLSLKGRTRTPRENLRAAYVCRAGYAAFTR
jgi:type 1 fimbriae regulatory protein FimB/type 1 fimbriae regulatory protein FimE